MHSFSSLVLEPGTIPWTNESTLLNSGRIWSITKSSTTRGPTTPSGLAEAEVQRAPWPEVHQLSPPEVGRRQTPRSTARTRSCSTRPRPGGRASRDLEEEEEHDNVVYSLSLTSEPKKRGARGLLKERKARASKTLAVLRTAWQDCDSVDDTCCFNLILDHAASGEKANRGAVPSLTWYNQC